MNIIKLHVSKPKKVVYFQVMVQIRAIIMQRLIIVVTIIVIENLLIHLEIKEMPVS